MRKSLIFAFIFAIFKNYSNGEETTEKPQGRSFGLLNYENPGGYGLAEYGHQNGIHYPPIEYPNYYETQHQNQNYGPYYHGSYQHKPIYQGAYHHGIQYHQNPNYHGLYNHGLHYNGPYYHTPYYHEAHQYNHGLKQSPYAPYPFEPYFQNPVPPGFNYNQNFEFKKANTK